MEIDSVELYDAYAPTDTPTPTAYPTSFSGGSDICLTPTPIRSATVQATPTPYGTARPTGSPTPTRTPGGPTATPTSTPTTGAITWEQLDFNSEADFATGLQPWTAGLDWSCTGCDSDIAASIKPNTWIANTGPDAQPGVAQIGLGLGYHDLSDQGTSSYWVWDLNQDYYNSNTGVYVPGSIILALPAEVSRPINVQFSAKALTAPAVGNHLYVQVWYLDPGTPSTWLTDTTVYPSWISRASYATEISYIWNSVGVRITPEEYSDGTNAGYAQAVALSWYVRNYDDTGRETSDAFANAVLVDDIQVSIGDGADALLAICDSDTTGTVGLTPRTHVCTISTKTIDVMGEICPQPSSALDVGGWLAWLGCSVVTYFTVVPENSAQIDAVTNYSGSLEPFGTLGETRDGLGYVQGNLTEFTTDYTYYERRTTDWGKFFNWATVTGFQLPGYGGGGGGSLATPSCQFAQLNPDIPEDVLRSTCFLEDFADSSGLLAPLQILIDLFCVAALFFYVRSTWMVGGEGGG